MVLQRVKAVYWTILIFSGAMLPPTAFASGMPVKATDHIFIASSGSRVEVNGTSTLHNWSARSAAITARVVLAGKWNGAGKHALDLKSIALTIPVNTLKSSEGGGMDRTMDGALHAGHHPSITYTLTKSALLAGQADRTGDVDFQTRGILSVNGVAKVLHLVIHVTRNPDASLTVNTAAKLKMTDFGVQPPTAMLGIIRSGNTVGITASVHLTAKK